MGRSFQKEIELLNCTYEYILNCDVDCVERFLISTSNVPLILVGSGGSFSVAKAFEYFNQRINGILSKAITPFDLNYLNTSIKNMGVALLTASGNNPDTVNAFQFINKIEPISFLTLCLKDNSKVQKFLEQNSSFMLYSKPLPSGKDGFLAVNSLIAMLVIIAKAYANISKDSFFKLDKDFDFSFKSNHLIKLKPIIDKDSIIVLHGGLTTPVAVDLESKFTEAALGIIQLTDYRNFAHGRHHWLARNSGGTSIIALISPSEKIIAQKTLSLIPKNIPIYELSTDKDNFMGLLELFREIFKLTMFAGEYRQIDPGKPYIPDFGRKLYHISYNQLIDKKMKELNSFDGRAAYRKCNSINTDIWKQYKLAFKKFYNSINSINFSGIIFDYDGTLKERPTDNETETKIYEHLNIFLENGILIGIATGRGKSVRKEMREKILEKHWNNVAIAYYNGGETALLSNNDAPNINSDVFDSLNKVYNELVYHFNGNEYLVMDLRPKQLSIMCKSFSQKIFDIITEICLKYTDIKILKSGHSLDIIPKNSTKLRILDFFKQEYNFLCFGDSGQIDGNDFELLSYKYGISVRNVSSSFNSCWNFAPLGITNSRATLYYLNHLDLLGNRQLKWSPSIK